MRTDRYLKPFPEQTVQQIINTAVQNVPLIPRRCNQNLLLFMFPMSCTVKSLLQLLQKTVARCHKLLFRQIIQLLSLSDLCKLELAYTHDRVIIIKRAFAQHHCCAERIVEHIYIIYVLINNGSLQIELLQIRHRHNHDFCTDFHKQHNQIISSDIVRDKTTARFGKHFVFCITGDVMDRNVGIVENIFDCIAEIFVEPVAYRIEHNIFFYWCAFKETFVISFAAHCFLFQLISCFFVLLSFFQNLFAFFQSGIVYISVRINCRVHKIHNGD